MAFIIPGTRPHYRKEYYSHFIDATAKEIGLKEKVTLEFQETFCDERSAYHTVKRGRVELKNVIKLNFSFLIQPKDVPKSFLLQSMDDPKIKQESFMKKVITWINGYLHSDYDCSTIDRVEKEALFLLLFRANNPKLLEKCRKWEIVHEMAYLHLGHGQTRHQFYTNTVKVTSACGLFTALGLGVNYWCGYKHTSYRMPFDPLLLVSIGSVAAGSFSILYTCLFSDTCKKQISEADAFAVKALKDKSGALYYFETRISWIQKFQPKASDEEQSDNWFSLTFHPTRQKRITQIQRMAINEGA